MSASIYWQPVGKGVPLDVGGAPSNFVEDIKKVFGELPCRFSQKDVEKLSVLAAMNDEDRSGNIPRPYSELIEIIDNVGEVEVFAIY